VFPEFPDFRDYFFAFQKIQLIRLPFHFIHIQFSRICCRCPITTGILQERAFANDKIHFAWGSVVEEIIGYNNVTSVKIKNVNIPEETRELSVEGIFLFIGLTPNTKLVEGLVNLDQDGYIIADGDMETSEKGIFACGDCIRKSLRQVVTACGDGATAANSAELYVDEVKGQAY